MGAHPCSLLLQGWARSEVVCLPWLDVSSQCRIGPFGRFIGSIHVCTGFTTKKRAGCRIFKILRYANSSSCVELSWGIRWLIFTRCFFNSLYFFSFIGFDYCFRTELRLKKKKGIIALTQETSHVSWCQFPFIYDLHYNLTLCSVGIQYSYHGYWLL